MLDVRTLTDGGQAALDVARQVADFLGGARRSLDLALYDVRLSDPPADLVRGALTDAVGRGVAVRLAYNRDHERPVPVPPPAGTRPDLIEQLPLPTRAIPGTPDLMHHKFVIRDGEAVWTGSTNWTDDSWTREENVIAIASSAELAAFFTADFEELWRTRDVEKSGRGETRAVAVGEARVRPWFSPGHGPELAQRIATVLGRARERIRVASPVITSAPILGTLAEAAADGRVDLAGVVDATQVHQVIGQWGANGNAAWKLPLLATLLERGAFTGKRSTPYAPGSVHDYMHAKVTVADGTVFVGSYNLSHSGELNAENVLEIEDAPLADRMAAFIDAIRGRYPPVELSQPA